MARIKKTINELSAAPIKLGLSVSPAHDNQLKREYQRELGLHETATWEDITHCKNERYRLEKIAQYDLSPNATWADIHRAETARYPIPKNEG